MDRKSAWIMLPLAVLLLGATLWSLKSVLGPFLSTALLLFVLWPYRQIEAIRRILIATGLILTVWILAQARAIVYPALAALALAFLLDPAVGHLSRRRIRRPLAALMLMTPVLAFILLAALFLVPALVEQLGTLIEQLPKAYEAVVLWLEDVAGGYLRAQGVDLLPKDLSSMIPNAEAVVRGLLSGFQQVGRGVASTVAFFSFLLLTPILTYYMLVDFDRLRRALHPYIPPGWRIPVGQLGHTFQESVGAWLKGQLLVALIIGLLTVGGFFLIGLPYALLLGCLAAVLNLVPVLGFWITALLAAAVAFFAPDPFMMLLKTAGVILVIQSLETHLLSPRIVGRQLGVKPVVLLLTMLGLSVFWGVLGVLLAAPVVGLARGLWRLWGLKPQAPGGDSLPEAADG
jgi:predicted PurR-regulated permease PerM